MGPVGRWIVVGLVTTATFTVATLVSGVFLTRWLPSPDTRFTIGSAAAAFALACGGWWATRSRDADQTAGLSLAEIADGLARRVQIRRELLARVRRIWIGGVLDRSLARVAHLELGLTEQPELVTHPWGVLLHQPGQPTQPLPPGTPIRDVAGRFGQHLLVAGAPGTGKTTLLLEYARDLLDQADTDQAAPVPVVFHLSGWPAQPAPLDDWLTGELTVRYGVPRQLATTWSPRTGWRSCWMG